MIPEHTGSGVYKTGSHSSKGYHPLLSREYLYE
jgi:hypothetical protein